ncbi:MAG: hypothetical protein GX575_10055 [Candidatus Anammoximicrobium sp.]|nr:hypothetical protein [Candidatus Anammoximicrobium sp.]
MLIPRFTIRGLLLLMTGSSFFFLVLAFAVRGRVWAIAVSVGVASLLLAFLGYAFVFGVAYVVASIASLLRGAAPGPASPFATAEPPPQIIPPDEPE